MRHRRSPFPLRGGGTMLRRLGGLGILALVALGPTRLQAQSSLGRITGTVTSETGEPVVGARVVVLSTSIAVATTSDGRFTILAPPGRYQVRASRLGYQPMVIDSVPVTDGSPTTIDFRLKRSALQLTEMVVVGHGSQQRRDVTGAVASVSAQEIKQTPTTNAIEALKGRVPGVDVVTTGYKPGDGVRVRIRGQRSILASNDPLYVLDGIPMAGGIGDLNPGDIESIEVLKDASATAIYGSRGANGVVLVTSKRGQAGNTRTSYDTYVGAQDITRRIEVFGPQGYADYKREAYRTAGLYKCGGVVSQSVCGAGDSVTFYAEELRAMQNGTFTDWQDLVSRQGSQVNHQLAVTGGNERNQFAVSG